jgi:hypothetical protein
VKIGRRAEPNRQVDLPEGAGRACPARHHGTESF